MQELQKNKKLTKKQQMRKGGDFFRDRLHQIYMSNDPEKDKFISIIANECKKYQKLKKRKDNEAVRNSLWEKQRETMNKSGMIHADIQRLDDIQHSAIEQAKSLVPLENLINPDLAKK